MDKQIYQLTHIAAPPLTNRYPNQDSTGTSEAGYSTLQDLKTALGIDALAGALVYQGTWNALTNSPAIPAAAAGNKGYYYKVATANGTPAAPATIPNLPVTDWQLGDWVISNGTSWDKIDNSEANNISDIIGLQATLDGKQDKDIITLTAHGFPAGVLIRKDSTGAIVLCQPLTTNYQSYGIGVVIPIDADHFRIGKKGDRFSTTGLGLAAETMYYLAAVGGGINYTAVEPTTVGQVHKEVFLTNTANEATIINGDSYELSAAVGGGSGPQILASGVVNNNDPAINIDLHTFAPNYKILRITIGSIKLQSSGGNLFSRLSNDGSAWLTTAAYGYVRDVSYVLESGQEVRSATESVDHIELYQNVDIGAGKTLKGEIKIIDPENATLNPQIDGWISGYEAGLGRKRNDFVGHLAVVGKTYGVQLYPSTGLFAGGGFWYLEGIPN